MKTKNKLVLTFGCMLLGHTLGFGQFLSTPFATGLGTSGSTTNVLVSPTAWPFAPPAKLQVIANNTGNSSHEQVLRLNTDNVVNDFFAVSNLENASSTKFTPVLWGNAYASTTKAGITIRGTAGSTSGEPIVMNEAALFNSLAQINYNQTTDDFGLGNAQNIADRPLFGWRTLGPSSATTMRMQMSANGNLGLGTGTTPAVGRMEVKGVSGTSGTLVVTNDYNSDLTLFAGYNGKVGIGSGAPGSRLEIKALGNTSSTSSLSVLNSTGSNMFFVRDDGHIGVGNTSPTEILKSQMVQEDLSLLMLMAGLVLEQQVHKQKFILHLMIHSLQTQISCCWI